MTRYFDKEHNRLIYTGEASDENYWDKHWTKEAVDRFYPKYISPFDYVINTTKKYLPPDSKILEGGCGTGQQVFKLKNAGYEAVGLDYAEKTVELINQLKPDLDIRIGDVRKLPFEDNSFEGYWSFGVIEHFYNGYDEIVSEMARIIKKNGYLFITFPHMSKLRKQKAKKGHYPVWENQSTDNFYQFALDEASVLKKIQPYGFQYIRKQHLAGIKGLKDEIKFFKKPLQKIFDSRNPLGMALSKLITALFNPHSSHSILLIFKRL